MHQIRKAALFMSVIAAIIMSVSISSADYQFDDVDGPSGISSQWVVLNDWYETVGGSHSLPIQISADLLTSQMRIDVVNGNTNTTVSDRNLHALFLVLRDGEGEFDMSVHSQMIDFDVSTPALGLNTIVNEGLTPYTDTISPEQSNSKSSAWKNYTFNISRQNDRNKYDTVIQSFTFQQEPGTLPSQSITRPIIISNVYSGTAQSSQAPLIVRMTLRDSSGANGNIIAYDRSTWDMTQSKVTGGNQWVMIPVDDLNSIGNSRIERWLTTEIANNTSYRYAVRYPDSTGGTVPPNLWKFDMFIPQGTVNIPQQLLLASESNIAPGLVTVYSRAYNVNEANKTPIHVFAVGNSSYGDYDLRLNHRIIYGQRLGETYQYPAEEGRFNAFEVTAFKPLLASTTFNDDVARVTRSAGTIEIPSTSIFSASSIKREIIAGDVLQYFTVDQNIPSTVRNSNSEGMLPLHITFNIPVTKVSDSTGWNEMLRTWRNTGRIEDMFARNYDLYLRSGENNVWNLTQELRDKGYYNELVKVFLDEERGKLTTDNTSGVLTVSFMVMLLDGTRDGKRPELSIVPDNSVVQQNNYIVIRDGIADNRWNMTFFVAPASWQDNPNHGNTGTTNGDQGVSGGSGGGGCHAFGITLMMAAVIFTAKRRSSR